MIERRSTVSSINLPGDLKARLVRAARSRGFAVESGRGDQLAEYVAYLIQLDETPTSSRPKRSTLPRALGLLSRSPDPAPTNSEIERLLIERHADH